ncbi:DNA polymerase III subunit delta [Frigoriflavimonas asaccharolytica]|uniref:DNA polymerase III subunit delta n=1 Tax=Frigoriflavimonas asaccharolytica TaxID=2735899 RepID=A0A8J8G9C3_9FLAO|nr:DNA polymerase III subunit delta [Frigoriflavimonas asaccharolytica]NRS93065.1 DNA polymerase-3 subunit delta [Frigoriflavimonas asaccharolytica]
MKELNSVLKSIKNKELLPFYFFQGEEPYYIDTVLKAFENDVLSEDEKAFGQTVIYGKDTNVAEIISLAQQVPMFGDLNLIIVKEAQDLHLSLEAEKIFNKYLENPVPTTTLVLGYKKKGLDSRKKFTKTLKANKMLFDSEPIRDYNLAKWIAEQCTALKIQTAPNISHLLAEYLGNDLSRIINELNKLQMLLPKDAVLNEALVEKHIGISKEYNVFELQNAIGSKNGNKTYRIVYFMGKNPKTNPLIMTVGRLFDFFSKLMIYQLMVGQNPQNIATALGVNPYFIKDYAEAARNYPLKHISKIISTLRDADMKSKGLGANQTSDSELLKEMVYKILNAGSLRK